MMLTCVVVFVFCSIGYDADVVYTLYFWREHTCWGPHLFGGTLLEGTLFTGRRCVAVGSKQCMPLTGMHTA